MPDDATTFPLVYAVVPAFNRCQKTLRFLRQFEVVDYPNKKVVICDDGSTDNTFHNIQLNFPEVDVLRGNGNLWWSGGTNLAIRHALANGADYILTINDDALMDPQFLRERVFVARQNPKFIVGCRIHRQDHPDRLWSLGTTPVFRGYEIFRLNFWDKRWDDIKAELADPYPVDTMPGNGVLIPRALFEEVGYFDDKAMPQYHADSDLTLRARRFGYQPVIATRAVLYNHILTEPLVTTRRGLIFSKKSDRYWRATWATLWRHGPFGKRLWLMFLHYAPFFVPGWAIKLMGKYRAWRDRDKPASPVSTPVEAH